MVREPVMAILLLLLLFASVSAVGAQPGASGQQNEPGRGGPPVSWSPEGLAIDGYPGSVQQVRVEFEIARHATDIDVMPVPGLEGIVVPEPDQFAELNPDETYQLDLAVMVPEDADTGSTLDGTLHLRDGNRTLAGPLSIEIAVTEEPDSFTLMMEDPLGEGTVQPAVGAHAFPSGEVVELQAAPAPGWTFDHWIIDSEPGPETAQTTVTMDDDVSVQAVFEEVPVRQTLDPGEAFTAVDGVMFGAPNGAIDGAVDIEIRRASDPTADVPLPDGWNAGGMAIRGSFYEVQASREISTPHGRYLVIGLPVPDGVPTDDLAFAVLSPPGSVVPHSGVDPSLPPDPSLRWHTERGQYDSETGLFGTIVPFAGSEPRVYGLVEGAGYSDVELPDGTTVESLPDLSEQEFGGFQVECANNFTTNPCTEDHQEQTEDALTGAYDAWVEGLGFNEPRLQHTLVELEFTSEDGPESTLVYSYDYLLSSYERPNGSYVVEDGIGVTYFPSDDVHPDPDDLITRHEFFHALQYGYLGMFENRDLAIDGVVEGSATASEMSLDGLTRSNREEFPGRAPRAVDTGVLRDIANVDVGAYALQDFWVYLGRRLDSVDPQISYLIPFFERGGGRTDLDTLLQDDGTFESLSDAYWQWVRNHAFEKVQTLGPDSAGNSVPSAEQCAWSGHGTLEHVVVPANFQSFGVFLDLEPLTAAVFEVTLEAGTDPRTVRAGLDLEEASHDDVQFKIFLEEDVGSGNCVDRPGNEPGSFTVDGDDQSLYVLVANTDTSAEASNVVVDFAEVEDVIFQAPDGQFGAGFGESVAAVGEKVLVGAPGHGGFFGAGRVYLFDANGTHLRTFTAPDAGADAHFGASVSAAGEDILVGAPLLDVGGSDQAGQAFLFDTDGNLLHTFVAPDARQSARFGEAVASDGEYILIGAPSHETDAGLFAGQAYLFDTEGNHLRTFAIPEGSVSDGFGRSLALVGGDIVVGSRHDVVYIFAADGTHLQTIEDPEAPALTRFGTSLAVLADDVLIGAPETQISPGFDTGRVYLFDTDGVLLQSFTAPDPQELAGFGFSVATVGENVLIGEPNRDTDAGTRAGQAYLFDPDGNHLETLEAPDAQDRAEFGGAVAGVGDSAVIGARNHETGAGEFAGQVYLFAGN